MGFKDWSNFNLVINKVLNFAVPKDFLIKSYKSWDLFGWKIVSYPRIESQAGARLDWMYVIEFEFKIHRYPLFWSG